MNQHLREQVKFLKDEVRRLESKSARLQHADNMEYLKNVLIQFLTQQNLQNSEREKLVEVLTTMLKLTKDERQKLLQTTFHGTQMLPGAGELSGFISRWTGRK